MKEIQDHIKDMEKQLELLADAKGILKCALIVKIYQLAQSISEGIQEAEDEYSKMKLVLEAKNKDLEEMLYSMQSKLGTTEKE